jgi:cell shape-determining protein MreC
MKEKTLLEMKKKVDALTNVMRQVFHEVGNLKDLSVGTLETLKLMNGYEEAIETLKQNMAEQAEKEKEMKKELDLGTN